MSEAQKGAMKAIGDGLGWIGVGLIVFGIGSCVWHSERVQGVSRNQRLEICLSHGGHIDGWDRCVGTSR